MLFRNGQTTPVTPNGNFNDKGDRRLDGTAIAIPSPNVVFNGGAATYITPDLLSSCSSVRMFARFGRQRRELRHDG